MVYIYNAKTRKHPTTQLQFVHEILPADPFYKIKGQGAVSSKAKALAVDVTGYVRYFEEGRLFEAFSVARQAWQALEPGKTCHEPGINWGTQYFCTQKEAEEFRKTCSTKRADVGYEEAGDVWYCHYHY